MIISDERHHDPRESPNDSAEGYGASPDIGAETGIRGLGTYAEHICWIHTLDTYTGSVFFLSVSYSSILSFCHSQVILFLFPFSFLCISID
jgi:hypothetical protein